MNKLTDRENQLRYFSWAVWSLLASMMLYFAEERFINIDGAFVVAKLFLEPEDLYKHIMRPALLFVVAIPNILALAGIKGKFLIYLLSASQIFLSGICLFVINQRIKKPSYSIGLLLTMVLFGNYAFYWATAELVMGLCFFWVWLAIIENKNEFQLKEIPWIFMWSTSHPTVVFVMTFYFLYRVIFLNGWNKELWQRLAVVVASVLLWKLLIFKPYEQNKLGLAANVLKIFPNYFSQPIYKSILKEAIWINLPGLLLMVLSTVSLMKKNRALATYFFGSFILVFMFINACYYYENYSFYIEANYTCISFIAVYAALHADFINRGVVKIILIIKVGVLLGCAQYWSYQLNTYKAIQEKIRRGKETKIILKDAHFPKEKFYLTDVSGYVSMCLNFLEPNKKPVHFVVGKSAELYDLNDSTHIFTEWERIPEALFQKSGLPFVHGKYVIVDQNYVISNTN